MKLSVPPLLLCAAAISMASAERLRTKSPRLERPPLDVGTKSVPGKDAEIEVGEVRIGTVDVGSGIVPKKDSAKAIDKDEKTGVDKDVKISPIASASEKDKRRRGPEIAVEIGMVSDKEINKAVPNSAVEMGVTDHDVKTDKGSDVDPKVGTVPGKNVKSAKRALGTSDTLSPGHASAFIALFRTLTRGVIANVLRELVTYMLHSMCVFAQFIDRNLKGIEAVRKNPLMPQLGYQPGESCDVVHYPPALKKWYQNLLTS